MLKTNNFPMKLKKNLNNTKLYVMRCAIWYHLYNIKNVKTPMEEC